MQPNLEVSIYSFRFITETLFPHEQFKPRDVAKGGRLYCLTQVFLDKIDPQDRPPVELLFGSLTSDRRFSNCPKHLDPALAEQIAASYKSLTHTAKDMSSTTDKLCAALHVATMAKQVEHAQIDAKYTRAFEAVESCLLHHPDKLAKFNQILSDWTQTSQGFRARGRDSDPFIRELTDAIGDI